MTKIALSSIYIATIQGEKIVAINQKWSETINK